MSVKNLLVFFKMVGRLKNVGRSGWISQAEIEKPESVADHSFRCAIMAMCIGDLTNVDSGKLIRMLLLHDIQEASTGDYDSYAKEKIGISNVKAQERNAMKKILSVLPSQLAKRYFSLWEEFEYKTTDEAILAHDIDKIEITVTEDDEEKDGDPSAEFWLYLGIVIIIIIVLLIIAMLFYRRKLQEDRDREAFMGAPIAEEEEEAEEEAVEEEVEDAPKAGDEE